jgi:hypothetical protein
MSETASAFFIAMYSKVSYRHYDISRDWNSAQLIVVYVSADNQQMKSLILQLAQQQTQYERVWVILHGKKRQVAEFT